MPGRALCEHRIFVVDKGGASVSADRPGRRRFATMAPIESKHDVRRKVRDAQAQVNRERLKRESGNREDMVAFLVAEQKPGAVSEWGSRTARTSPAGSRTTPRRATPGRCPRVGADA